MVLEPPLSASRESEGPPGYALRVLVVDDERDAVLTLMALLRDDGYEVRGAYRAKEALDLVRDFAPHAVLLDIGMPDIDGYEAARQIRSRYGEHGPLLIAVTGWKKSADKLLAKRAGFNHHVAKPYDAQALLGLLKPLKTR
ncbi:MAG TPA: response regulator [Burkholderiales bacterium]